ncbi:unnamed protein product [Candida verbasci]|uniref:Uncharacterized protein n=1 Tax=Candida verbasci TaxID=1227364 RepID=A0A9W4TX02_9ASCO|nr:unnamed protein product [Candida verbasci]
MASSINTSSDVFISGAEEFQSPSSPEPDLALFDHMDEQHESILNQQFELHKPTQNSRPFLNDSQKSCIKKTLVFIGYTISTILFSLNLYIYYFFIKLSYDDETAMKILNNVTRVQENAINNYHRRNGSDGYDRDD